ncbi:MAG: Hpt domain-containing protein [Gemmatimonadota bacterium]|nr:Hpt domain-containing protein [Gemmatimonadota bacterium]
MPEQGSHWDELALDRLRRFGGDGEVRELLSRFTVDIPTQLTAAREALSQGDAAAVGRSARALRSSATQLGAASMAELAGEIEEITCCGTLHGVRGALDELSRQFERFVTWIDDRGTR